MILVCCISLWLSPFFSWCMSKNIGLTFFFSTFFITWKIFKNSSPHLEIKKFHLEIQISQSRNLGDLTQWATWLELVVSILGTHRIAVSILLHRPHHSHSVCHAHTSNSLCSFRLLLSHHRVPVRPACPKSPKAACALPCGSSMVDTVHHLFF